MVLVPWRRSILNLLSRYSKFTLLRRIMANIYADNCLSIGRTPLIKLNRVTDGAKATVLAKIEGRNPAYSVKCRLGAAMIWDAEKRAALYSGQEIVKPPSGNTGIALAFVTAALCYKITSATPE